MKEIGQYHRSKRDADGHVSRCKECVRTYHKKRRSEKPEHVAEVKAADYQKHRNKRIEAARSWTLKNPERPAGAKRDSRLRLSETIREKRRERYASDPFYRAARQAERVRRKRSRAKMTTDNIRLSGLYRVVISEDPCFYCGTEESESSHVDHYVPVGLGGTDHWWDLVQDCANCNLSKHDSMPLDFINRIRKREPSPVFPENGAHRNH